MTGARQYVGPEVPEEDRPHEDPSVPRRFAGWDRSMSDAEAFDGMRAWWRLAMREAERQAYVVGVSNGDRVVRTVARVDGWIVNPRTGRKAFRGELLGPGDPVFDAYHLQPDPVSGRNAVGYFTDERFEPDQPCRCGCGAWSKGPYRPGHEAVGVRDLVVRAAGHLDAASLPYASQVAAVVDWYDSLPEEVLASARRGADHRELAPVTASAQFHTPVAAKTLVDLLARDSGTGGSEVPITDPACGTAGMLVAAGDADDRRVADDFDARVGTLVDHVRRTFSDYVLRPVESGATHVEIEFRVDLHAKNGDLRVLSTADATATHRLRVSLDPFAAPRPPAAHEEGSAHAAP
ncbi:hypothetical protein [Streptodolium elevatio]|uniref:Uncharacterized protein n=1 Tax=Streptodolium elevatio TaxID=3157996 RepID=A0ABV3DGP7_9ACTN